MKFKYIYFVDSYENLVFQPWWNEEKDLAAFRDPEAANTEVNIIDGGGEETRVMAVWRKLKEDFKQSA